MGQLSASSQACQLVREGGDPVPACVQHLLAEVQEQADLVGHQDPVVPDKLFFMCLASI